MKNVMKSITNGCIDTAKQLDSPNKNGRPDANDIRLIIIHNISLPPEKFGNNWIDDFFLNKLDPTQHPYFKEIHQLEVSSHLLIRRDGSITQYVPFHERAWHAGQSSYNGCDNCNDFSIGIELEGADDTPYTKKQYIELASCCNALLKAYPTIPKDAVVGHCDVAPGRKTDPGDSFNWVKFRALLSSL